ncbi:hypothetical protein F4604DRAFT_1913199 [Suillus subluteus]|nr:hypothetical protein F4604DRAFT_1913199 [Suillus subluteus]
MSVACFSAGLMLFTYTTNQGFVTSTITTVFTAVTSFGLAAVSAWFASECWIFVQHRGHVWLEDVINEATHHMLLLSAVVELRKIIHYCNQRILATCGLIRQVSFKKEGPQMLELAHRHEPAVSVCSEYTERPNSLDVPGSEESEASRRSIARHLWSKNLA